MNKTVSRSSSFRVALLALAICAGVSTSVEASRFRTALGYSKIAAALVLNAESLRESYKSKKFDWCDICLKHFVVLSLSTVAMESGMHDLEKSAADDAAAEAAAKAK